MKAIQTVYNGYKFRSRLEARWAVFFDESNINYQYEPEGFVLNNGLLYLPDFFLPDTYLRGYGNKGVYIEIKHEHSDMYELDSFELPLIIFHGDPMRNTFYSIDDKGYDGGYETGSGHWGKDKLGSWDNCMRIWQCAICNKTKIEFLEGNYDCCVDSKCNGAFNSIGLGYAASSARSARFEHGETP